jgi:hypothetical protein
LKDAMRQAASSLETLKLLKPDQDPRIERLLHELRASSVEELRTSSIEEYREAMSGD